MPQTVKVGIFMTVALVVLGYLIFRIEDLRLFGAEGRAVEVSFDSVAGLDDKSPVRVAGVRVGRVDGVRLADGGARVTLRLEVPVELTDAAKAKISNLGILGDKYVELDPGPAGAPPLAEGAVIPGTSPPSFDEAMGKFGELGDSLRGAFDSLDTETLGPTLNRMLANMEAVSADVRLLVAANRDQIDATVGNFARLSGTLADELPGLARQMESLVAQIETVVGENRDNLRESFEHAADLTASLRASVDNLGEISGRLARGEGTIGKLLTSDETHDQLVSTLASVESGVGELSEVIGRVQKIDVDLGIDTYYLDSLEEYRSSFAVDLDPKTNRSYHLALVDDPRGRERSKRDITTVTLPDGTVETTTVDRVTVEDKFTLSAQVGFTFGDARFRTGLFESTGGAGLDYSLWNRRVLVSLEAFDFGREGDLDPRLRLTTRWFPKKNVYLLGGYDDALESRRDSFFLGVGIRWRDDDLKYLAGSIPSF